jgi:glycosyltransferase involved in cell wall biosynthesis
MPQLNVLTLFWHSTYETHIAVGGVRRIIELAKRIPTDMHFWILDNSPPALDFSSPQFTVVTYRIPGFIYRLSRVNFLLGRLIEMATASVKLFLEGRRVLKSKDCAVIYSPMGGLLFFFLPAVFLKFFHRKAILVIDIFDFELPYGSVLNYYRRLRKDGYSFLRAFLLPVYIKFQFLVIKVLSRKVDCILTVSQYQANFIEKTGAKSPVGFASGGIDYKFIESVSKGGSGFDAVFVGRHTAEKGIFDLLEIWRRVVALRPASRLALIGTCDRETERMLADKVREYRLVENVVVKGVLSEEEKIGILKASQVFIHPGRIEPLFPVITVLEALACGLPAVLYDLPSYKEQPEIYSHPAFALVAAGDYDAAAKKAVDFMEMNGSLKANLTQRAREYASRYDWNNIADSEFKIIRDWAAKSN